MAFVKGVRKAAKSKAKEVHKPVSKFVKALKKVSMLKRPAAAPSSPAREESDVDAEVANEQTQQAQQQRVKACLQAVHATISSIPYHAAPAVGVTLHPAALTSVDPQGFPSTRTVVPTLVASDLSEVRMSTRKGTRKLAEIQGNSKVAVHFQDQRGRGGWVTLKGCATTQPGAQEGTVEVILKPTKCEALSYVESDLLTDEQGFKPVLLEHANGEWRFAV